MKTYRVLVDNEGRLYKDGDAVKLVLNEIIKIEPIQPI